MMIFQRAKKKVETIAQDSTVEAAKKWCKDHWYIAPIAIAAYKLGVQNGIHKTIDTVNRIIRR